MYIPIAFIYIFPVSTFGWFQRSIRPCHWKMSKRPFLIMGALDALSSAMQVLCSTYLPGTLLVLLPQAAIPFSMMAGRCILKERFTVHQYIGATTVIFGIVVVLFPVMSKKHAPPFSCQATDDADNYCTMCEMETSENECLSHLTSNMDSSLMLQSGFGIDPASDFDHACQWVSRADSIRRDDFLVFAWSLVLVASTIPMTLSSVYKQVALSEDVQLDPIFVNGWVAIFQFLFSLPLSIPAGFASSPPTPPMSLPNNWWNGIKCLIGSRNYIQSGCHPDQCDTASLWVHLALLSSAVTTVAVILMLKYGSTSLLYLALTATVPIGHLVFELHSRSANPIYNSGGLIFSVVGLLLYRFGHNEPDENDNSDGDDEGDNQERQQQQQQEGYGDKGGYWEFLREPFVMIGDV